MKKKKINEAIDFIKTGIWEDKSPVRKKWKWAIQPFRIILYTIKGIGKHETILRSAVLTIYTIISIIPIAALAFGILKGFGFEAGLTDYLYKTFPKYSYIIDTLMEFVDRALMRTKGGVIAAVGIVVLLWSVIRLFSNIEAAFNQIWEVKKARSIPRKFSDYITAVFVIPILLVSSISLGTFIRELLLSVLNTPWLVNLLLWLASLVLIWALFAFVYWIMPNTRVKPKGAIIAAIITGTISYFFSIAYFLIQGQVSSYSAIYGTFAAIPLFLIWLQMSWRILLIGGELSFAYQNIDRYESEQVAEKMDGNHRRKVLVATMLSIVKHYLDDEGGVSSEEISEELNVPVRIIRDMVYELEKADLVLSVKRENDNDKINLYVPARDVHTIRISDVINRVESNTFEPDFNIMPEMKKVSNQLDKMQEKAYDPQLNVYLIQLIDE